MRSLRLLSAVVIATAATAVHAETLPLVRGVDRQPLEAQARRVVDALKMLGEPLSAEKQRELDAAVAETDSAKAIAAIQAVFDPLCLAGVDINPESRVKVAAGPAPKQLVEHGWRVFLIKVHNLGGVTAPLSCRSPNSRTLGKRSINVPAPKAHLTDQDVRERWMEIEMVNRQPMGRHLSGLELEYAVLQVYSRDAGRREAKLVFDVGQGTQDLGFRSEVNLLFQCAPAVDVRLSILDHDGRPVMGSLVFRDSENRVYPALSRRLAPDFFFHDQVYRSDGESVKLPAGRYVATYTRGPEYKVLEREVVVPQGKEHREEFRLARWIHMADHGWYSGDHHVHAAGCAHYDSPTQGVTPQDMWRQVLGEDLNVGCVLSWGPCWYYQKRFFEGRAHDLSSGRHLLRYDIECSGFPSSHAGHICLLRLSEDDYPGTTELGQWPSWDLPILKWGKSQGAVVGFAHSGFGLQTPSNELPNFEMPRFDGIGANEFIVDVTHDACDFISAVDTPIAWELNIWYHTLNCGYTTRISGETDFPCISGQRIGMGRSYVKLPAGKPLDYDAWVAGVRDGRSYVSDGFSHLFDFSVDGMGLGESRVNVTGVDVRRSVLAARKGQKLKVAVRAAALLAEKPKEDIRRLSLVEFPYWHVEKARVGDTRQVPVELVVNGRSVERKLIDADGSVRELTFEITPQRSSWIAVRILPSAHTNPIFVEVDGRPIRASKRSATWCRQAVDVCWKSKQRAIKPAEQVAAAEAYDHARRAYDRLINEAAAD